MGQAGRGLAFAIITAIVLWIVFDTAAVGPGIARVYAGALLLSAAALVVFLVALLFNVFNWNDAGKQGFQSAVTNLAIGAASVAIVGLVALQLAPSADNKPNLSIQAGGLITILVLAALFLFSDAAPKISLSKLPLITTLVAVILMAAYGLAIVYMLNNAGADEKTWARYLVLFTAVQGVGLAAVGALLGTQVKQGEVNQAKTEAERAKADVKEALDSAATSGSSAMGQPPSTATAQRAEARLEQLRARYGR